MRTKTPTVHRLKFEGRDLAVVETKTDLDNEKHTALKNVDTCPLDRAFYKMKLIDEVQHQAGSMFHAKWRHISVGSLGCPDLDRLPGESTHATNEAEMRARIWLKDVHRNVGWRDWVLLRLICGEEKPFEEARHILNDIPALGRKVPRDYIGPRFAESLDALALHMGLTQVRS